MNRLERTIFKVLRAIFSIATIALLVDVFYLFGQGEDCAAFLALGFCAVCLVLALVCSTLLMASRR